MRTSGLVSVVIAAYNGERFIADAIASVSAQTYQNREVIVVDDGSTDDTANAARRAGADRVISLSANSGVSTARNIGISVAHGMYVTTLDADDMMLPDRLRIQVDAVEAAGSLSCAVVGQRILLMDDAPPTTPDPYIGVGDADALVSSALFHTETLLHIGGFNPALTTAEDMDMLFRIQRFGGTIRVLDDIGVIRRLHGHNVTWQADEMRLGLFRAVHGIFHAARPLVSVIIPVRDGARYLGEALQSVHSQDLGDQLEIVVVDDGSLDTSVSVARSMAPSAVVVSQPPLGVGSARNHGVLLSSGKYLAFLDADDRWSDDKLKNQLAVLEEDAEVDAVFGAVKEFVSPELDPASVRSTKMRESEVARIPSALMIRRSAFARAGAFPGDPESAEFVTWFAAALEAELALRDVLAAVTFRRRHDRNLSARYLSSYPRALKDIIDRRRNEA